jgi:hypothetical protein
LINRKPAGIYVRLANAGALTDWSYAGTFPDVFSDANFSIFDDSDSSKEIGFSLGGLTTGTKRVLTPLDKNYTLEETGHASKHQSGGVDAIKLDDFGIPDDNTDLDASTSKHGLMPKVDKVKLDKLSIIETLAWDFQMSDGSDLTTGAGTPLTVFAGTITGWRILVIDGTGSITFDLRKDTYANFPPTSGDTIVASAPPSITSTTKGESSTLTGWTTALTTGDVIVPHITAGGTGIKKARLEITVERT